MARQVRRFIDGPGALMLDDLEAVLIGKLAKNLIIMALLAGMAVSCGQAPSATPAPTAAPTRVVLSGTGVIIEAPALAIKAGETFSVPLNVINVNNLIAAEVHLSYDAEMLEVLSLKNGGLLQADFTVQNNFDNAAGTIDFALAQIGRAPASGDGVLFEITFRAKKSGDAQVQFRPTDAVPDGALLSDPDGKAIKATIVDAEIKISAP